MSHFSYAPLFQARIFRQKCFIRTFFLIIYLLTFLLFDDIEKNQLPEKHILTKMHVQAERLYFYIFILRYTLSLVIVAIEKHQKQLFYSSKTSSFGG